ncbi:MAG: hypothetical protein HFH81_00350 [Lachnospiraceae bacterium]|jgi:hypothetical protein|nr:hypothetical protein [Lachnospiraceae bacterium]
MAVTLAKSPLVALKVLRKAHTEEAATFLEQDSTTAGQGTAKFLHFFTSLSHMSKV